MAGNVGSHRLTGQLRTRTSAGLVSSFCDCRRDGAVAWPAKAQQKLRHRSLKSCSATRSASGAVPGCGAGRKSHYLPTTGVDDCPAPPPSCRAAVLEMRPGTAGCVGHAKSLTTLARPRVRRNCRTVATPTPSATMPMMTVASALMSGDTPSFILEKITIGSVMSRGPRRSSRSPGRRATA